MPDDCMVLTRPHFAVTWLLKETVTLAASLESPRSSRTSCRLRRLPFPNGGNCGGRFAHVE
jgi:hypothetical protein